MRANPDLLDREAAVLLALWNADVRVPELLAIDNDRGALVMSFVDGAMRVAASDIAALAAPLTDLIAGVHRLPVPRGLPAWRPWGPIVPEVPAWAGDQDVWRQLGSAIIVAPLGDGGVLLHRDLHPLNVLWRTNADRSPASPALIDWVNACVGHPHADLAHCRWNLAVLGGPECADRFLERYLLVTDSSPYDPAWDLIEVRGLLPGPIGVGAWHSVGRVDLTESVVAERTEAFLATALESSE